MSGNRTKKKNHRRVVRGRKPKRAGGSANSMVSGPGTRPAVMSLSRVVELAPPVFRRNCRMMLRYHDTGNLVSASGVFATLVYATNGLYDPNISGTGHQPKGFDTAMLNYINYCVDFCKITVQFQNTAAGSFHCGMRLTGDSSPSTTASLIIEDGGMMFDVLESKNAYGSCKTMSMNVPIARFRGISRKALLIDPQMSGQINANPIEIPYLHVFAWDPQSLSGTVFIDIVMEFYATFYEPRTQALSLVADMKRVILSHLEDEKRPRPPSAETAGGFVEVKTELDSEIIYLPSNRMPFNGGGVDQRGRPTYCNQPECRFFRTNAPHERCSTLSEQALFAARVKLLD